MEKVYRMKNLDCGSCASKIERSIKKLDGVDNANISFMSQRLTVEASPERHETLLADMQRIAQKIEPGTEVYA